MQAYFLVRGCGIGGARKAVPTPIFGILMYITGAVEPNTHGCTFRFVTFFEFPLHVLFSVVGVISSRMLVVNGNCGFQTVLSFKNLSNNQTINVYTLGINMK